MFRKTIASFKNRLLAGILVIIPIMVTYIVIHGLVKILRDLFNPIFISVFSNQMHPLLESLFSLLVVVLGLYLIGVLSANFAVKRLISFGEKILSKIPIIKFFYLTSKQVIESLALMKKRAMNKVVVIEYPRRGIRCLAFVTGEMRIEGEEGYFVNIFLPSTPNPTTGFYLMLPPDQVWDVNLTLEEATKMLISGGILVPKDIHLRPYKPLPGGPITLDREAKD